MNCDFGREEIEAIKKVILLGFDGDTYETGPMITALEELIGLRPRFHLDQQGNKTKVDWIPSPWEGVNFDPIHDWKK